MDYEKKQENFICSELFYDGLIKVIEKHQKEVATSDPELPDRILRVKQEQDLHLGLSDLEFIGNELIGSEVDMISKLGKKLAKRHISPSIIDAIYSQAKGNILGIVEDNINIAFNYCNIFKHLDYRCIHACDYISAIERKLHRSDLLLLDYNIPIVKSKPGQHMLNGEKLTTTNGIIIYQELSKIAGYNIPAIMVTGNPNIYMISINAKNAGIAAVLSKLASPKEIQNSLDKALNNRPAGQYRGSQQATYR